MMTRSAVISPCGLYRYRLTRVWDPHLPRLAWVLLNPSTADGNTDDATVRVACGRARLLGYGTVDIYNLFAYRATSPADMRAAEDPIGPDNGDWLYHDLAMQPRTTVVGWGDHGLHLNRAQTVEALLCRVPLYHLRLTKRGQPCHPLRIPYSETLKPHNRPARSFDHAARRISAEEFYAKGATA